MKAIAASKHKLEYRKQHTTSTETVRLCPCCVVYKPASATAATYGRTTLMEAAGKTQELLEANEANRILKKNGGIKQMRIIMQVGGSKSFASIFKFF